MILVNGETREFPNSLPCGAIREAVMTAMVGGMR